MILEIFSILSLLPIGVPDDIRAVTSRSPSGCFSAGVDDSGNINGEGEWEVISPFDESIGVGKVGGLLMPSKGVNLALVIERNKFEPISRRDLPSFLSVPIWFVSGG